MTIRLPLGRSPVCLALGALAFAFAAACGGSSFDTGGRTQPITPHGKCSANGQTAPAGDGCNTCMCSGGAWACTTMACVQDGGVPQGCTPGATRPAGDGCNNCTCGENGAWMCTFIACNVCSPGQTTNDGCNTCTCSGGQWACTDRACPPPPPPACANGDQKKIDCNTCTCESGAWACTKMACQCVDGQTMGDGCNTCTGSGGIWACTARACPPPPPPIDAGPAKKSCGGFLGNTCAADEYCAYAAGEGCGEADGSALCEPRPSICDTVFAPVCGCDGNTYGNTCEAARAGTGVL